MGYSFSLACYFWRLYIKVTMMPMPLIILFLSIVALLFLVQQLLNSSPEGQFLKSLRDLLAIILALGISIGVFYVGFRIIRFLL